MKLIFTLYKSQTCTRCYGSGFLDYHVQQEEWQSVICIFCRGTGKMEFKKL